MTPHPNPAWRTTRMRTEHRPIIWQRLLKSLLRIAALTAVVVLLGIFVFPNAAHAGQTCEAQAQTPASITRGMALAERTSQALDASGAQVVVLARAGQDLSKYGLHWSHLGFAYKTPEGPWRVVHKLNQCATASASIWRQGLGEFFLDQPWRYETAWVVPPGPVQTQMLALLGSRERIMRLNTTPYSVVSYAWGRKYQQSNQWAIETLASAIEPGIDNRERAQAWLKFRGYAPTTLRLGPFERLGGRVGSANIAFDDHPNEKRFSDRIETVTVDSVFAWLARSELGAAPQTLQLANDL